MTPGRETVASLVDDAIAAAAGWGRPGPELILVRHGQPAPAPQRGPCALPDPPLSGPGQRQARAVRQALAGAGVRAVYASTLDRARGTAQIIGDGLGLPVTDLPDLREIELLRPAGPSPDAPGQRIREAAASFARCGRWDCWPGSEPGPAFRQRVRGAITDIARQNPGGATVIVCHSGVINACISDALDLGRDYCIRPMHASLTRLRKPGRRLVITSINETGHLTDPLLTA